MPPAQVLAQAEAARSAIVCCRCCSGVWSHWRTTSSGTCTHLAHTTYPFVVVVQRPAVERVMAVPWCHTGLCVPLVAVAAHGRSVLAMGVARTSCPGAWKRCWRRRSWQQSPHRAPAMKGCAVRTCLEAMRWCRCAGCRTLCTAASKRSSPGRQPRATMLPWGRGGGEAGATY